MFVHPAIWSGETIIENEIHEKLSQDDDYKADKGKVKHWLRHPWSWYQECIPRLKRLVTPNDHRIQKLISDNNLKTIQDVMSGFTKISNIQLNFLAEHMNHGNVWKWDKVYV